jgi:hypothetical protein
MQSKDVRYWGYVERHKIYLLTKPQTLQTMPQTNIPQQINKTRITKIISPFQPQKIPSTLDTVALITSSAKRHDWFQ